MNADRFDTLLAALTAAPSRRAVLRVLAGLGLAGLVSQTDAKKHSKKKKCAKAGQRPGKKRKRCCAGLAPDGSGVCRKPPSSSPPSGCPPATCPAIACGNLPDGCGGTLSCGCPANQICLRSGVCQPCTVTCTGTSVQCGDALQTAMNGGGTIYVCPGTYRKDFLVASSNGVSVIGAGEGDNPARDTILESFQPVQVLLIFQGSGTVELERLRITGGSTDGSFATGIYHEGSTLRMTECTVSGNTVTRFTSGYVFGGGIFLVIGRTLEMTRCTVRDNHVTSQDGLGQGGGIYTSGMLTLTDCLVEANSTDNLGGGLYVSDGTTILAGTTQVRGNTTEFGGGIFVGGGTLTIAETCRVTENTALGPSYGGGIFRTGGTVTLGGGNPSPSVVNNCYENCAGTVAVPMCSPEPPVSCPP